MYGGPPSYVALLDEGTLRTLTSDIREAVKFHDAVSAMRVARRLFSTTADRFFEPEPYDGY